MHKTLLTIILLLGACGGRPTSEEPSDQQNSSTPQNSAHAADYSWRCGDHIKALRDAGEDTGAGLWCDGDVVMGCSFACGTYEGENRCDAEPHPAQPPCEWGCVDDMHGNASCAEAPEPTPEPPCSEETCTTAVHCMLPIEGTGTCDSPPTGGTCYCSDGEWSCSSGCPEGCDALAPEEGDPCAIDGLECRYYYAGTMLCTDGTWGSTGW